MALGFALDRRPRRSIRGAVVVITGASSGIGRACAERFAERGARLVLSARAREQLEPALSACRGRGAECITVAADVALEDEVAELARQALERFGRIDVWINCAGVIAFARFVDLPSADFRRVIETNLFGQVHGARAALAQFTRQGAGVLINVSSVWGRVTSPYVSAYVTSKFAIRALSNCLREEFAHVPGIAVVTILPQAVDTPIWQHAANRSGHAIRPVPPVSDADRVARRVLACAERPRREITVGRAGRLLELTSTLAPGLYARLVPRTFQALVLAPRPAPDGAGNLYSSASSSTEVSGGWRPDGPLDLPRALRGWRHGAG